MADKETIVTTDGGGSGAGMIIALVLVVALLVGCFFLYRQGVFTGGAQKVNADTTVQTPAKTN